jgi:Amt family ammonium transporter
MLATAALAPYPTWLHPGDNAWQMTAATLVGLMSVPGLVVLYGGVMQKRWSVNSMMLTFMAFGLVLVTWVLWAFDMGFGNPAHLFGSGTGLFQQFVGVPGSVLSSHGEQGIAYIPNLRAALPFGFHFPEASLVYFQFVFAAITPILMLGSVLGRVSFKAWIPFVVLWITCAYSVNAFLLWGGGFFAAHGALDFSGGYVIHLAAGISGFVAAAVIGPRLARDREIDAPNNLLMVAVGAGLLWLGWNGFNGGDPYFAGTDASVAVINTNLCTAVAMLIWVAWDMIYREKPGIIGTVNGMITGLVAITPAAGYVNGYGAICLGVIASTVVWMAIRYLSRIPPFSKVDDTLGVVYTHGIAGVTGGLLVAIFADPGIIGTYTGNKPTGTAIGLHGVVYGGNLELLKWQFLAALAIIVWDGLVTFILLKLIGLVLPLREPDDVLELGDSALHGHEVYPADVVSLGSFGSTPPEPAVG